MTWFRIASPPDGQIPPLITSSAFTPAWWLRGPHRQTLFPSLCRRRVAPSLKRERIELPDGDFIDLDWSEQSSGKVVLVVHGLEGSLESHYIGGLLTALAGDGYNAGLMYLRNCSEEQNRLARSYHSGETGDLDFVVQHILKKFPGQPLIVIGFSLGGNILLKWLGEQKESSPVHSAIAISVPFDLNSAALNLEKGLSRIYQRHLLDRLKNSVRKKAAAHPPPVPLENLHELQTFRQFDDRITAPLHGFRDVDDYYTQSSSKQFLKHIRTPTLIIQAEDDPFLPAEALPVESELSPSVTLELSGRGGHVGFISGVNPLKPQYWLEHRIQRFLAM
jgi:predicted alpha/beta-fold hydrolase